MYLVDLYIQKIYLTGLRILTYWWYLCWLLLKPGDTSPDPEPSLVQLQNFRFSIFKTNQTCISNRLQGSSTLCMFSILTPLVSVHRLFVVVWLTLRWFPLLFVKNEIMFSPESSSFILRGLQEDSSILLILEKVTLWLKIIWSYVFDLSLIYTIVSYVLL